MITIMRRMFQQFGGLPYFFKYLPNLIPDLLGMPEIASLKSRYEIENTIRE